MRKDGRLIHIVVALPSEARPIVRHLSLQRMTSSEHFDTYHGDGIYLIVSGIGKVRSAVATTYLATRFSSREPVFTNIGIAGAAKLSTETGELWTANQVIDFTTRREFYPDRLIKSDLPECTLVTHDGPVTGPPAFPTWPHAVDMEASGFMEAASRFTSAHSIVVLKVISDFLDTDTITRERVTSAIEAKAETITEILHRYQGDLGSQDVINEPHTSLIDRVIRQLRLTKSQSDHFKKLAMSRVVRVGHLDVLSGVDLSAANGKHQRDKRFKEMCELLVRE